MSALQHPVLDEPIAEAVCIIADTDKWSVQVATSQRKAVDGTKLGQEVLVSSQVSSLHASALSETSPTCIHFKSSQPSSGLLLNHIVFHMEPSTSRAERNPEMCSASGPFGQLGPPLIPVGPAQSCRAPCPGAKARGGRSCPRHLPQTRPAQHPTYSTRWGWTPSARRRSFRWPRGCEPGTPASRACSSARCPSRLSAAQCPRSSASGSRRSRCCRRGENPLTTDHLRELEVTHSGRPQYTYLDVACQQLSQRGHLVPQPILPVRVLQLHLLPHALTPQICLLGLLVPQPSDTSIRALGLLLTPVPSVSLHTCVAYPICILQGASCWSNSCRSAQAYANQRPSLPPIGLQLCQIQQGLNSIEKKLLQMLIPAPTPCTR